MKDFSQNPYYPVLAEKSHQLAPSFLDVVLYVPSAATLKDFELEFIVVIPDSNGTIILDVHRMKKNKVSLTCLNVCIVMT